jgi:two-component system response regulator
MTKNKIEILLIEDNSNDAELTTLALKKGGIQSEVLVLRDGAEAIEALAGQGPFSDLNMSKSLKLVLLDLKMPKVNGFEVLKAIRANAEWSLIPIVILTSSAVEADVKDAYKLGANSYIVKPIEYRMHSKAITEAVKYWTEINKTLN